jgi:hypothetical protein
MFIKPLEIQVTDADKVEHSFTISRMPATTAREVVAHYTSGLATAKNYEASEKAMLQMMQFVGKEIEGNIVPLKSKALIDNHIPDGEALIRLEIEMMRYNTSFFGNAGSQNLKDFLLSKVEIFKPKIMQMLTALLQR